MHVFTSHRFGKNPLVLSAFAPPEQQTFPSKASEFPGALTHRQHRKAMQDRRETEGWDKIRLVSKSDPGLCHGLFYCPPQTGTRPELRRDFGDTATTPRARCRIWVLRSIQFELQQFKGSKL